MKRNIEIIVGTYEEFLLGYNLNELNGQEVLTQSFADKSHCGAIKCVAVGGHFVATGATDDRIFIYDMRSRKQAQILLSHDGTVNALAFTPDKTHLLSGGDDGRMIATRTNTWFTEATWKKAHNGSPVTHISCHPSGKMALSLGTDLVLRTWNLVKGRVAYKTNLKNKSTLGATPDCLAWSPGGSYFTLSGQRAIEIWSIKTADVIHQEKVTSKPVSICWIADDTCLSGLEDGKIIWITVQKDEKPILIEAHNARVKAMAFRTNILVTASSTGEVKLWEINNSSKALKEIAVVNIGCRPTCISILDLNQFGDEYTINNQVPEQEEKTKKGPTKSKARERGVVTIEYENDDDDDNDENHTNTASTDDEDNEQEKVESAKDSDEENTSNSDEDVAEPQIRLPKSRKRRQQILAGENATKHVKLNENAKKQSPGNKSKDKLPQQKTSKQKPKSKQKPPKK